MSQHVRKSAEEVASGLIATGINLTITKEDDGGNSYSHDVIQSALLLDIAKSLRDILRLLRCPNVAQAVRDVNQMGKIARRKLVRRKR